MKNSIATNEWYQNFIEECRAIVSEAHFSASIEVVKGKWELGKRILEEELSFKRAGYGEKMVEMLSKELGISSQTLWKCIQFYKKFPEPKFEGVVGKLETGTKTPTWHQICTKILPLNREICVELECDHDNLMCLKCRKRFKKGNIN